MHFEYELFGSQDKDLGELAGYRATNFMQFEDAAQPEGATYYTPLNFWFCKDPGSYLPLLAMQFTDVHLSITTEKMESLLFGTAMDSNGAITFSPASYDVFKQMDVVGHYVFLDQDEREAMATQGPTDYPILTTQRTSQAGTYGTGEHTKVSVDLDTFAHPVQYLTFAVQEDSKIASGNLQYFDYAGRIVETEAVAHQGVYTGTLRRPVDPVHSAQLLLNAKRRFREPLEGLYMRQVVPYMNFRRIPRQFIYTINFALQPGSLNPSGSANFSRLDTKRLELTLRTNQDATSGFSVIVRAVSFNVLRVANGVAGILYAY